MQNNRVLVRMKDLRYRILMFLLTAFFCTVLLSHLQYSIGGISIMAYQIFGIIFVICFWLHKLIRPRSNLARKQDVAPLISLYLFITLGAAVSSVGVFIMLGTYTQFLKGLFEIVFMNIFLISLVLFLGENKYADAKKFLYILLIFTSLSCFYQFFAIYFQLSSGIFLDELIWPKISSWTSGDQALMLVGSGEAKGFRHGGLLGSPNTMATLLICAVPISLYFSQTRTKWMLVLVSIFFISLISGMSRSGMFGLAIALLSMLLVSGQLRFRQLFFGFFYLISIPILIYILEDFLGISIISGFLELLTYRLSEGSSYEDSSRYQLLIAGLDMLDQSPIFGVGINSSPIILQDYPIFSVTGGSLHNYWLELFVAHGLFVIPSVMFYLFLVVKSISFRNIYSKAMFASLCGLIVNGFFHSSMAKFGIQVFILLLYMCSLAIQSSISNNSSQHGGQSS